MSSSSIGVYAREAHEETLEGEEGGLIEGRPSIVRNLEFSLDHVFDSKATGGRLWGRYRERVARVAEATTCASWLRQTARKTHTVFGPDDVLSDWSSDKQHGVALRAITDLFGMTSSVSRSARTWRCTMTLQWISSATRGRCRCVRAQTGWRTSPDSP